MSLFRVSMAVLFPLFFSLAITSEAEPNYLYHICSNPTTPNDIYLSNREQTLYYLSSNSASNNGFCNTTAGETPDIVYGLFLCRGDVSTHVCHDCVTFAVLDVVHRCPFQKVTVVWYDECLLRYSNHSSFTDVSDTSITIYKDPTNNSFPKRYQERVLATMHDLASQASNSTEKFGTGVINFPTLYILAQCTQDLSESNCQTCLELAIAMLPNGAVGARTLTPSCIIRYEIYLFYNQSAAPSPVSPPPLSPPPSPLYLPSLASHKGNGGKISTRMVIVVVVVVFAVVVGLLGLYYCARCCQTRQRHQERETTAEIEIPIFQGHLIKRGTESSGQDNNIEIHNFNLRTIREATSNFSDANKLGEGGFGPVYKGELPNGEKIAVKRLSMKSRQGIEEFKNEVMLIVRLQHRNLVKLLGYCLAGDEKLLVYEYMANTSLDTFLFDPRRRRELDWDKRANIINGTARGLQYLHEDSRLKIIHRDLKTNNVLLDECLNPKISDFGTARIFGENQLEANTERIIGTFGYMAPEYAFEGLFSIKSDVYSFGVLMLEIITGRKCRASYELDDSLTLLSYASKLWTEGEGLKLIDPEIIDTCPKSEVLRWIHIALLCVQNDAAYRPTMPSVSLMLGGNSMALPKPLPPPWNARRFKTMLEQPSMSGARISSLLSELSLTGR